MPKKKTERQKLIKKLDEAAKTLAKQRDKFICQRCGKQCTKSNAHGSHVIPVSAGNKLRWDLNNIKCLCYHDHLNWWHKNPTEAGQWFREKFPERMKYLETQKGIKKFTIVELRELLDYFKYLLKD